MDDIDERFLVYTALATVCATLSAFVSLEAGLWTFLQATAVIELMYWLALPPLDSGDASDNARTF